MGPQSQSMKVVESWPLTKSSVLSDLFCTQSLAAQKGCLVNLSGAQLEPLPYLWLCINFVCERDLSTAMPRSFLSNTCFLSGMQHPTSCWWQPSSSSSACHYLTTPK